MGISNIISLFGGVALFLFGMSLMGDGLKKIAGNRLEVLLYKLTNTPWKGLLLGTGVTAIIQSSSATSVMVIGFVNSGMMQFRQAIGIVMGAILGTSVTGWLICLSSLGGGSGWVELFSTTTLTGIVAVVGIIFRMFSKKSSRIHAGDIMLGFAVLMFGMSAMSGAVAPMKESESFIRMLTMFSNPILGILVGTAFTAVLQSASAAVGILQALCMTGAIDFATAFPLIMGIAIGGAVPVLISAISANTAGKRTSFVYFFSVLFGAVLFGSVYYITTLFVDFPFNTAVMSPFSVALLNTAFRLVTILTEAPAIGLFEKAVCRLIKEKTEPDIDESIPEIIRFEDRFLRFPPLAISQSREGIHSMAILVLDGLTDALGLLHHYTDDGFAKVEKAEDLSDRYEDKIGTYLVKITKGELSTRENEELSKYLHTLSDFERIGDHALNLAEVAKEIHNKKIKYSDEAMRELSVMQSAVTEILTLAVESFVSDDLKKATLVEPLEEVIDALCDELKMHHVERLQKGVCTLEQGFTFNDLMTNYERIADHCSNIALAMIELEDNEFNTHEYLKNIENMKQKEFTERVEDYHKKYSL